MSVLSLPTGGIQLTPADSVNAMSSSMVLAQAVAAFQPTSSPMALRPVAQLGEPKVDGKLSKAPSLSAHGNVDGGNLGGGGGVGGGGSIPGGGDDAGGPGLGFAIRISARVSIRIRIRMMVMVRVRVRFGFG